MRHYWTALGLLWLAGVGLRLTILAVPPVISLIQADLHLSGTGIGILSGLPTLTFGVVSLMGSLLVARFGTVATLIFGTAVAGIASSLRGAALDGAALDITVLYAATTVMSIGIALVQPALPALVREWLPQRIGFGTAVYTNGLLVGETLAVMLTIPLLLPLVDGSWRSSLVIWGIPLVAIAVLTFLFAPPTKGPDGTAAAAAATSWWPDWSDKVVWQAGLVLASVNSEYFACNAFLPGHLAGAGRPDLVGPALTVLNFGQLPASFVLLAVVDRIERRAWPFILCGVLILTCVVGISATASVWTLAFCGGLGFLGAVVFTLGFALPALLAAPADVARISAAMFTISYSVAVIVSVLSGVAWDLGGSPRFAFLPIALAASLMIFVPATIRFGRSSDAAKV
jgi:MFS transporter, CP family, cyanate transporter